MTSGERLGLYVGGLAVVAAAIGGALLAVTSKSQPPPSGPVVFQPGRNYLVAAPIPTGSTTAAAIATQLTALGFTNVQVVYFGPQGVLNPNVVIPFTVGSTMYAASGTYSGSAAAAPPSGMSVVAL